jgi:hypothetical protein
MGASLLKEADFDRIGTELEIAVPGEYRALMRTRAADLQALTHPIRGKTFRWFDETLYFDADEVIRTNLIERRPDSGTGYAFPDWWRRFFLIGSDGGGGYYSLRLDGESGVWMIGSDCGDPQILYGSLAEFVDEEVRRHREEARSGNQRA